MNRSGNEDVSVCYLFKGGRKESLQQNKLHPSDFFYGYLNLHEDIRKSFLEDDDFARYDLGWPWNSGPMRKLAKNAGVNLSFWRSVARSNNFNKIKNYSIVFATTNTWGLLLGLLWYFSFQKPFLVFLSMGALEIGAHPIKIWLFKKISSVVTYATLSKNEKYYLEKILNKKVQYLPFGIDVDFWDPGNKQTGSKKDQPYVFSIGNDRYRDFDLLVRSWKQEYPLLRIVTRREVNAEIPKNVEIIDGSLHGKGLSDEELRDLYREALFVVIPLHETVQPSGQSVALQAMSCEKAVLIGNIQGLWDDDLLIEGETCISYSVGNGESLQLQIERLLDSSELRERIGHNSRKRVVEMFSVQRFGNALSLFFKNRKVIEEI